MGYNDPDFDYLWIVTARPTIQYQGLGPKQTELVEILGLYKDYKDAESIALKYNTDYSDSLWLAKVEKINIQ